MITRPTKLREKKDIYDKLDRIDSLLLETLSELRGLENSFLLNRDKKSIKITRNFIESSIKKNLIVKGRIKENELGTNLFQGRKYLVFNTNYTSLGIKNYKLVKRIPLRKSGYNGLRFSDFMKREFGAMAEVLELDGKKYITRILIPEELQYKIKYG